MLLARRREPCAFNTKAELFLAVYERQMDRWISGLEAAMARVESVSERTAAASAEWLQYARDESDWFRLYLEFWAHAINDDDLRTRFAEQSFRLRHAIGQALARDAAEGSLERPLPADQLAVAVNALGNGLLIDRALRPEAVPDGLYGAVLLQLFESLRPPGWPRVDARPSSGALSGAAQPCSEASGEGDGTSL